MKKPRPKKPNNKVPKRVLTQMKKNGLAKIWEVKKTPNRKDDKAFVWMTETCSSSGCSYKLVRFGSIASEAVRFDSQSRNKKFRARHGCDKKPAPWNTARRASCDILWPKYSKPRTVKNCSNCKKK